MPIVYLPDRGVTRVAGADARGFLNGLLTADVDQVSPQTARFAAILSPQGKILVDFLVIEAEEADGGGFYLDAPRVLCPDLAQRLALYRLRARVTIEDLSDRLGVAAVVGEASFDPMDYLGFDDPRLPGLGRRLIGERAGLQALGGDTLSYHALRIGLGVPEGGKDFAYGDAFPHEALMDQLGGVDFAKGCYVGQEVVSRMQHRGTVRTRIVVAEYEDGFAPIEGVEIVADGKVIGRTGSQHGGRGIALIRLDKLHDALAAGHRVSAGGIGLKAARPEFARYDFAPGAA